MLALLLKIGIALAVVVVIAVAWLWTRAGSMSAYDMENLDVGMPQLAADAVKVAKLGYGIDLDYSANSIAEVEKLLGGIHETYHSSEGKDDVARFATVFGAYIGEAIKRSEPGGHWERDHPVGGPNSYPLHWGDGASFPMAWCQKRIINGPEDNVWHKYQVTKRQREQRSSESAPSRQNP